MFRSRRFGRALPLLAATGLFLLSAEDAAPGEVQLNPKAVIYLLPDQIPWKQNGMIPGVKSATLVGDPAKNGFYVQLIHWSPHQMSHPHFHPNDRFITVLSGTWWVGTGTKFDPDKTVPMPAGSFVTHFAHEIHFDGAKDEDAVIEIVGIGPATLTPAEEK